MTDNYTKVAAEESEDNSDDQMDATEEKQLELRRSVTQIKMQLLQKANTNITDTMVRKSIRIREEKVFDEDSGETKCFGYFSIRAGQVIYGLLDIIFFGFLVLMIVKGVISDRELAVLIALFLFPC